MACSCSSSTGSNTQVPKQYSTCSGTSLCHAFLLRAIMRFNKLLRISHSDDESAVGADLSRPPPHCISHKRGIAETWRNGFQVPIYRPKGGSKILRLFCKTALSAPFTADYLQTIHTPR